MDRQERVSVFVINYNGKETVVPTIQSLFDSKDVKVVVQVIDDGSTDGSVELINQLFPDVVVHQQSNNTRKVNHLRNKAIGLADTNYVFLTDNDIIYNNRCIKRMVDVMSADQNVVTCMPRLMYWDEPSRVYTAGGRVHFIGATIAEHRGEIVHQFSNKPVFGIGGGNLLLDRNKFMKVGGLDEDYHLAWGDDGELYQRLLLAGYKCFYLPNAFGLHKDKPFSGARHYRAVGQLYNRWMYIFTHYSVITILLLMPVFVVYESATLVFYIQKKIPYLYFKGTFLVIRNIGKIIIKRKKIQSLKVVSDKDVLFAGKLYVAHSTKGSNSLLDVGVSLLSSLLNGYWKIIKPLIP